MKSRTIIIETRKGVRKERGLCGESKLNRKPIRIFINSDQSPMQRFSTLIHEFIHVALYSYKVKRTRRDESIIAWSIEKIVLALLAGIRESKKNPC